MQYLPSLPSYATVKGYLSDAKTYLSEGATHVVQSCKTNYPLAKEAVKGYYGAAKEHAGRAYVYIKDTAVAHPTTTVGVVNLALFLSFNKIVNATTWALSYGVDKENAKKISAAVYVVGVVGVNYALAKALELTVVPVAIAALVAGVATGIILAFKKSYDDGQKVERTIALEKFAALYNKLTKTQQDAYAAKSVVISASQYQKEIAIMNRIQATVL